MKITTRIASLVLAFFLLFTAVPVAKAAGGTIKTGIAFADDFCVYIIFTG